MLHCRIVLAVVLGSIMSSGDAAAQSAANESLPGGYYRGRFIGFKPRHGQVHRPPRNPIRTANASVRVSKTGTKIDVPKPDVAPSAYARSVVDDAQTVYPEASSDITSIVENDGDILVDAGADCCVEPMCPVEPRIWVRGEYLQWWAKGMGVPALATTSPAGTSQEDAGVLGSISTTVLFGGGDQLDDSRSGGRITFGMWLDSCQEIGIELSYLGLNSEAAAFQGSSDEFSILARPFFDVVDQVQDSRLIAFPDLVEGSLAAEISTEFKTGEIMLRRRGASYGWSSVDYFYGYRYAELEDGVSITESTVSLIDPTFGTTFELDDVFQTRNRFQGAQIGTRIVAHTTPCWTYEFVGKIALGNTNARTAISGQTVVTTPDGGSATQPSGLLVQDSNRGFYETNEISTITEIGLTLQRRLKCGWSLSFGYSFLFWTDVVRAGEQIDASINASQIPPGQLSGEPRPAFRAVTNDFWAQGLNLGLAYRY